MSRTITVGVVRGGPSNEYEVSLNTGGSVLRHLPEKYRGVDIFIDRNKSWHVGGVAMQPQEALRGIDVVFNALHGAFGEDGEIQGILDNMKMPYTGSGKFGSALAMKKHLAKDVFIRNGIRTPNGIVASLDSGSADIIAQAVHKKISPPWFVKPSGSGSSVGTALAKTYNELLHAIEKAFEHDSTILIEERIAGREATCGVVDSFRGKDVYALPPIEIVPPEQSSFFDNKNKYDGTTQEICPGRFSREEKENIERLAIFIHKVMGLRHYSRSDFIVSKRGVYALEVNTLPGLTDQSLVPKAIAAVGCAYPQFLDHLVTLALATPL